MCKAETTSKTGNSATGASACGVSDNAPGPVHAPLLCKAWSSQARGTLMMHWNKTIAVEDLQSLSRQTAAEHCGIEFTQIGDGWVEATIPLDARTRDIQGTLHPGALGILAETIGSIAASLCIDNLRRICVGQILHVN